MPCAQNALAKNAFRIHAIEGVLSTRAAKLASVVIFDVQRQN